MISGDAYPQVFGNLVIRELGGGVQEGVGHKEC